MYARAGMLSASLSWNMPLLGTRISSSLLRPPPVVLLLVLSVVTIAFSSSATATTTTTGSRAQSQEVDLYLHSPEEASELSRLGGADDELIQNALLLLAEENGQSYYATSGSGSSSSGDMWEDFFKKLANGKNREKVWCENLKTQYLNVCKDPAVFQSFCKAFKHAYLTRCNSKQDDISSDSSLLATVLVIGGSLLASGCIHHYKIETVPCAAATIIIGVMVGGLFWAMKQESRVIFDEGVFFRVFLPFIIFQGGLEVDKKSLRVEVVPVVLLATVGTIVSALVTGGIVYGVGQIFGMTLPLAEALVFGSLISPTDPVATLSSMTTVQVDQQLYTLLLGESTLNDGVAIVMYESFIRFIDHKLVSEEFWDVAIHICYVLFGSVSVGVLAGYLSCYFFKYVGSKLLAFSPAVETLFLILWAVIPYYICDILRWSGVIAILSEAMVMDILTFAYLSPQSKQHSRFTIKCLSDLFETIVFAYLGLSMLTLSQNYQWDVLLVAVAILAVNVGRAASVFPICGAINYFSAPRDGAISADVREVLGPSIPMKKQILIWFSSFRGAVSFALAVGVPRYDEVTREGSHFAGRILSATAAVIIFQLLVFGACLGKVVHYAYPAAEIPAPLCEPLISSENVENDSLPKKKKAQDGVDEDVMNGVP